MRLILIIVLALLGGQAFALVPLPPQSDGVPLPTRDWPMADPAPDVDAGQLKTLLDQVFTGTAPEGTRAVLIVHRGVLVAERYAPGFGKDRRFLSQSVAKTVLGALAGIAVHNGALTLDAPAPVAAWRNTADPRHAITLRHLLQMTDGLDFNEAYFNPVTSDVLPMLFGSKRGDMAAYATDRPLAAKPGTRWAYSSGTANLVSGLVRDAVGGTRERYLTFMKAVLLDPIGMTSAEPEFDESGTFVGSSWLHATARDWARFGLLMLRGGVWNGAQILPKGWVDFMRTPQPNGVYGAMIWVNTGMPRRIPNAPPDVFMATGHRGQVVAMVPSKDLVIVRFGKTGYDGYGSMYGWIGKVISLFPDV